MTAHIKTGVTSWAERSLLASGWYPPDARSAEARLRVYAARFPLVENDATYWALPDRARVEMWARRTPPGFTMNVKAHALLTGHYTDPKRLPKALRARLPPSVRERERVYPRHLAGELLDEVAAQFSDALAPLQESGKLGVVLFQFPLWFPISRDNQRELARIRRQFAPFRVAVEFRNKTWMSEQNRDPTLALLAEHGLIYTCVDEPQGFVSSVPPIAAATAELAVVRLHGRNRARWAGAARSAAERFEYLYSVDELRQWVQPILGLADATREVHVLFNNCYRDYAVHNARQMAELLDEAQARSQATTHAPA